MPESSLNVWEQSANFYCTPGKLVWIAMIPMVQMVERERENEREEEDDDDTR